MTYAVSAALQQAVFQRLADDPGLGALVAGAVFDTVPAGPEPSLYVSLGPEEVRDRSDKSGRGATHDLTISVVSDAAGFLSAKIVAGVVSDALLGKSLALSRGRLVSMSFLQAKAGRFRESTRRRIDLRFRARVEDQ